MTVNINNSSLFFLRNALSKKGANEITVKIIDWLKQQNDSVDVKIEKTSFDKLRLWQYFDKCESIKHLSGKFFTIDGINLQTNWGRVPEWDQPIINQPEIGFLGMIVKEIEGVLYFLMQAKIEPGNVNYVQLSPTLQATKSNYTCVHKGKKPLYLKYFQNVKPSQILLDQIQSEQGGRFLKKRNRNIIVKIDEEIPVHDNFFWLTLPQIKELMHFNNLVNMDTRTVIAGLPFTKINTEINEYSNNDTNKSNIGKAFLKSAISENNRLHRIEEIISFLTILKCNLDLEVSKIPLNKMKDWIIDDQEIYHKDNKYFKVIAIDVKIGNREVVKWNQPMIEPVGQGLCAFVCKEIKGLLHFAVQAKLECGNFDIVEFAPTVQCLDNDYRKIEKGTVPFLDYVLNTQKDNIIYDALQSEEGGRFYREQNRYMIIMAGNDFPVELPPNYIWMTLNQLYTFLTFNNYVNIQARSLISAIRLV